MSNFLVNEIPFYTTDTMYTPALSSGIEMIISFEFSTGILRFKKCCFPLTSNILMVPIPLSKGREI